MKLKYMIHNTDQVAETLLASWEPVATEVHFFRASSNYVHIFKVEGNWRFIRFSRVEERDLVTLEGELEYLLYLRENGYSAAYPMLSKQGCYIETAEDENGKFHGLVFEKSKGNSVEYHVRTPAQFSAWGKALGELHNLSRSYRPKNRRKAYEDWFQIFRDAFSRWQEVDALAELDMVQTGLSQLARTEENYGLIHYDFQYDNTFWNQEEQTFHSIDFDDAHYHFYAMDVVAALADLEEEGPKNCQECADAFYAGYKSVSPWAQDVWAQRQLLHRYADLMNFYRINYSLEDSNFDQDPEWLAQARPRWTNQCQELRQGFRSNATR